MPKALPLVSIILPTFNGSKYIQKAMESILGQTLQGLELIIIDDGSTDDTASKINAFKDERVNFVRLEKNQGHIAALNQGFAMSKGGFLSWTSDDNFFTPQAIERMASVLQQDKAIDFVYAKYQVIDDAGVIQRYGRVEEPAFLDLDNYVGGCFLYRRKVYETIGDFNPDAFLAEDYEYWLRVRERFKMKKLDEVLYFYREHGQSLTGVHTEKKVQIQVQKVRDRFIPKWKRLIWRLKSFLKV